MTESCATCRHFIEFDEPCATCRHFIEFDEPWVCDGITYYGLYIPEKGVENTAISDTSEVCLDYAPEEADDD